MSNEHSTPKTADWAPGTLDHTRKNIGSISETEAKKMQQVLGGEVMRERTEKPHINEPNKNLGVIAREQKKSTGTAAATAANASTQAAAPKQMTKREDLPEIPRAVEVLIDKLMMSPDYGIKPNYGLFNFIRKFQKNGTEKVVPEFVEINLKMHMDNMETFMTDIKSLIQIAPNTYKAKIVNAQEAKFKFLRMVANWTTQGLKFSFANITQIKDNTLVADLIPYIRAIYRPILTVYYYGENKIPKLIKEIYADIAAYPDVDQNKVSGIAKSAITQWLYISTEIIQKLYPLLMRMCSSNYEEFPDFFKKNIAEILKFLGLHKYDLLLPEKTNQSQDEEENNPEIKKEAPKEDIKGKRDESVEAGLSLLNQLFPQAGFDNLESFPDLFPYFQPLYNFAEGFNMLSPQNPIQVTVVLIRILEDFLRGCRNISFNLTDEEKDAKKTDADTILKIQDDWSAYREDSFEKLYCRPLIRLVNETYSNIDFLGSQLGKKYLTEILWYTRILFLPYFKFQQVSLEKPGEDSKYPQLSRRTNYARTYLTNVVKECDKAAKTHEKVDLIENPWDHYYFDVPNEISKRLDVLLGGQKTSEYTNANNANLLKYTLCILAVLDWWICNPESPAYSGDPMDIYRVSAEDGKPFFSSEIRSDQNKLFADSIRAAYQKKK